MSSEGTLKSHFFCKERFLELRETWAWMSCCMCCTHLVYVINELTLTHGWATMHISLSWHLQKVGCQGVSQSPRRKNTIKAFAFLLFFSFYFLWLVAKQLLLLRCKRIFFPNNYVHVWEKCGGRGSKGEGGRERGGRDTTHGWGVLGVERRTSFIWKQGSCWWAPLPAFRL